MALLTNTPSSKWSPMIWENRPKREKQASLYWSYILNKKTASLNGTISQESQLFFGTSNKIVYKRQIPLSNNYKPKEDNIIYQTLGKSSIFFLLLAKINIKLFLIDWIDLARKKFNVIRPKKTSAFSSSATRSGWKKILVYWKPHNVFCSIYFSVDSQAKAKSVFLYQKKQMPFFVANFW